MSISPFSADFSAEFIAIDGWASVIGVGLVSGDSSVTAPLSGPFSSDFSDAFDTGSNGPFSSAFSVDFSR